MKRLLTIGILSLVLTGCGQQAVKESAENKPSTAQAEVIREGDGSDYITHACGVTLKNGKTCKRRVSNGDYTDSAVEAPCWQHRRTQ